jgi:hypothetical protein
LEIEDCRLEEEEEEAERLSCLRSAIFNLKSAMATAVG